MLRKDEDFPRTLAEELGTATSRVRELAAVGEAFGRRPEGGGWSAAECVDHLNATARLYLPALGDAIEEARRKGLTGERGDGRTLLGRLVARAMEPPARLKMKTFGEIEPDRSHDPEALAAAFADLHGRLAAQLQGARGLDRKRIKVRSLLDSRLKLSLDDWYAFLAAHVRRHLWQAERALEVGRSGAVPQRSLEG